MGYDVGDSLAYASEQTDESEVRVWVLAPASDQIFDLGMPGSLIWREALEVDSRQDLVSQLCHKYGWEPDVIEMDVMDFLKDLVVRGWLKEQVLP